jgi:glucuronokinase
MIDAARDLADAAVIALEQVPLADVSKYGIAQVENIGVNFRLLELVEKPTSETAPSRWAIAGRYLLTRTIFDHLRSIAPGSGGEIQLTDALRASVKAGGPSVGVPLEAGQRRYDVGEFESYFRAFEDFARVALRPTHGATRADTLADAAQNPFATDRDQSVGRACARAGLLGNPSDGYGGKVISCILGNWQAEVRVSPSQHIEFLTGLGESPSFESASAFVSTVRRQGYYGGLRLVQAATKRFFEYCGPKLSRDQWKQNFQVEYQSNIPRQLGLGGSSAIVIATLRALSAFFGVALPQEWLPSLALSAETQELGIPAGLQDRVIQTYEGLMYMDFASETIDAASHLKRGEYQRLDERLLPDLYVAFRHTAAEPTEVVHSDLRKRFDQGDSNVVSAMRQFAEFARLGREAILRQDIDELARLMNANFDLRRSVCQILPEQLALIQVARGCGVCAKFCGSGGAVVGILSDPKAFERLRQAMASIGASVFQPKIGIWH